ncbi:hypothetical protein HOK15_02385, partial [Candidatus Falkowbacteria bacterium]|nr:hypothetical protein [Candidatus Falkowbacteria bacterium]
MTLDLNNKKYLKWLGITLGIIFIIALILFGTSMALAYKYSNQIYPGIKIDDVNLGGLTKTQATNIIKGKFKQTYKDGFTFSYLDNTKQIENLDENILTLNLESLIDQAFTVGHNDAYWKKYLKLLAFPITKKSIPVDYRFDKELLKQNLQTEFAILEKPAQNSEIIIEINDPEEQQYTLDFSEAKQGETFNFNQAINQLDLAIQNFSNPAITLIHSVDQPQITKNDALTQSELIKELLQLEKIIFTYTDKQWEIGWEDFTHWLELDLNEQELVSISLNQDMVNGQLESIGQEINQPAIDAKLQIKAGRVAEFQASEDGLELNQEESYNKILQEIIKNKNPKIELIVEVTNPEVNVGSTNDLGIKEMIGSGWSDFSGSPSNRRHNIGIGAASLHGALIAPGEEFSLIGILGDIDGQHGYKPELVIKKGETIPEYGGGLCQVGTTIFRSVLQSGLKITARRNHS